jgi:indole-3-glycerol phosphate synthase
MSLKGALTAGPVAVIAEIKRRSPSRGVLLESMDAARRARLYHDGGARAISVLTEPSEFAGSVEDLESVRRLVSCPLIRKDFHVHPVQMFEARVSGASAALIIVRAVGPDDTRVLADAARQAGIEPVVEVRDDAGLTSRVSQHACVVGSDRPHDDQRRRRTGHPGFEHLNRMDVKVFPDQRARNQAANRLEILNRPGEL